MTTSTAAATIVAEFCPVHAAYGSPTDYASVVVESPKVSGTVRVHPMARPDALRWESAALTVNGVTYRGSSSHTLGEPVTLTRFTLDRIASPDTPTRLAGDPSTAALRTVAGILPDVFAAALALPEFRRTQLLVAAWYAEHDAERNEDAAQHARTIAAEHDADAALSRDAAAAYRAAAALIPTTTTH